MILVNYTWILQVNHPLIVNRSFFQWVQLNAGK